MNTNCTRRYRKTVTQRGWVILFDLLLVNSAKQILLCKYTKYCCMWLSVFRWRLCLMYRSHRNGFWGKRPQCPGDGADVGGEVSARLLPQAHHVVQAGQGTPQETAPPVAGDRDWETSPQACETIETLNVFNQQFEINGGNKQLTPRTMCMHEELRSG